MIIVLIVRSVSSARFIPVSPIVGNAPSEFSTTKTGANSGSENRYVEMGKMPDKRESNMGL